MLESPNPGEQGDRLTIVVVKQGDKYTGLIVDAVIGQQEIVQKPLGKFFQNIKVVTGATILGDGKVSLILDVNALTWSPPGMRTRTSGLVEQIEKDEKNIVRT